MTALFEPIGEVSQRQMITDVIARCDEDDVVSYDALAALLGVDDRGSVQRAVNGAKLGIEREYRKALLAVANVGYRVVRANEHDGLAKAHQLKSMRGLARALSKVVHVDYDKLTEGEKAAVTISATSLALQIAFQKRHNIRASRTEAALKVVQSDQVRDRERSATEMASVATRLERLEQAIASRAS